MTPPYAAIINAVTQNSLPPGSVCRFARVGDRLYFRDLDHGRLLRFGRGLLLSFCIQPGLFCFSGAQFFGLTEQDFAEAGRAFSGGGFFRFGALLFRADQGAVCVLMGFANCLLGRRFFCGYGGAVAVVLRGHLQSVDEDAGAAGVDAVGG
ncbi:hypothetical protein H7849_26075 [Alloacidobacterium dinghuense]|uniref:Uncharacterized protein n=1 Tax=Alloacidobacterium dinghuense TaxID=2763107 RepID=A0A7G8BIN1_9BACT|nr:hypothetical protein [Alloacidobacterium dinghuense]QNI32401.1 hypothetical protein H7849_26075 [Alloacidobacterium dinghuense]